MDLRVTGAEPWDKLALPRTFRNSWREAVVGLSNDPRSLGVLLYGSYARQTATHESDVDILHLVSRDAKPKVYGPVNISEYLCSQLDAMSATGSVFALHLKTEGRVLSDPLGILHRTLDGCVPRDDGYVAMVNDLALAAQAVDPLLLDAQQHLRGLVRLGTYLIRSALYIASIERREFQFDVDAIARSMANKNVLRALAVRKRKAITTYDLELTAAILRELLPVRPNIPGASVEQLAVQQSHNPTSSSLILGALYGRGAVPYNGLAAAIRL